MTKHKLFARALALVLCLTLVCGLTGCVFKLFARALALVLCLTLVCGLTGCVFSTPESVGRIGEVDITSGNYLLAQYDAYQQAADLAQEDQDPTKVSAFLRTPESVGRIGEVDITSGNYLLAQYDAYQQAADLAQEDQDPTKVSAFLRQQITPEGGEPVTVADFVAEKTQRPSRTWTVTPPSRPGLPSWAVS